mmetsp:Transcript_53737/g.126602  ORF Transcript_53737/g.126602 Transcript_53737/m.126602 type:complete len:225 (-) Transcript_53737:1350-2024(-)
MSRMTPWLSSTSARSAAAATTAARTLAFRSAKWSWGASNRWSVADVASLCIELHESFKWHAMDAAGEHEGRSRTEDAAGEPKRPACQARLTRRATPPFAACTATLASQAIESAPQSWARLGIWAAMGPPTITKTSRLADASRMSRIPDATSGMLSLVDTDSPNMSYQSRFKRARNSVQEALGSQSTSQPDRLKNSAAMMTPNVCCAPGTAASKARRPSAPEWLN